MRLISDWPGSQPVTIRPISQQLRTIGPTCLVIYPATILLLAGVLVLASRMGQPLSIFLSDPVTVMEAPPYYGAVSNLGVLIWGVGGAIAVFSAAVLRARRANGELGWFLLASGLWTMVLAADDLFLLHETILPHYLAIPQNLVLGAYAVLGVAYLIRFWKMMAQTDWLLIGIAFAGLGLSVVFDTVLKPLEFSQQSLLEDGSKLIGIVSWTAYFWRVGSHALVDAVAIDDSASPRGRSTTLSSAA